MQNPSQITTEEAFRNGYRIFIFTLEVLSRPPMEQCELMGDFNTAWELRDDALRGHELIGSGLFTGQQETAVLELMAAVEPIPVDSMPYGAGREPNLAAMLHPTWQPIRTMAEHLLDILEPVTEANRAYFDGTANAP
jgi:hypothetical protein